MPHRQIILITGAAGYIGSHTARHFLERGHRVIAFDNLSHGYREAIETLKPLGDLTFIRGDLLQQAALEKAFAEKVDAVLHFAALCSVDESMREPGRYFETNVQGTLNLLEVMGRHDVSKIIFSSTCAVYGEPQRLPVDESHPTSPTNPYGESKLMAERLLRWYGQIHGIRSVIFRYFNVCGASTDGLIGDSKKPSLLLVPNAVRGAMGITPFSYTCAKVDTPDGTPIRDFIDVNDLVEAHALSLDYLNAGGASDTCNLGTGRGYSVQEIVSAVEQHFNAKLPERQSPLRQGEQARIYADASKARRILGWEPKRTLTESIKSLRKWYERRPEGFNG